MQHLDEGTIHAWLDGALPQEEAERVARHASSCMECGAAVADARGLIAGASRIVASLDTVRGGVIPSQATQPARAQQRSLWRMMHLTPARAAIAATLLMAVATTLVLSPGVDKRMRPVADTMAAAAPRVETPKPEKADVLPAPTVAQKRVPSERPMAAPAPQPSPATQPSAPKAVGLQEVVATSAPPPPARDSVRDTIRANADVAMKAAAPAAAAGAAGAASATQSFRERALINAAPNFAEPRRALLEGCYRIVPDTSSWLRGIPERIALARDSVSGLGVVRSISPAGRIDSVLAGSDWRRTAPNGVAIQLVSATRDVNLPRQPVTIQFVMTMPRARAFAGGQTGEVGVQRTECRP